MSLIVKVHSPARGIGDRFVDDLADECFLPASAFADIKAMGWRYPTERFVDGYLIVDCADGQAMYRLDPEPGPEGHRMTVVRRAPFPMGKGEGRA